MNLLDPSNRWMIRWHCPKCGRQDVRHPLTKPEEMPLKHTPFGIMGSMFSTNLCDGIRVAQTFNQTTKEWENTP